MGHSSKDALARSSSLSAARASTTTVVWFRPTACRPTSGFSIPCVSRCDAPRTSANRLAHLFPSQWRGHDHRSRVCKLRPYYVNHSVQPRVAMLPSCKHRQVIFAADLLIALLFLTVASKRPGRVMYSHPCLQCLYLAVISLYRSKT